MASIMSRKTNIQLHGYGANIVSTLKNFKISSSQDSSSKDRFIVTFFARVIGSTEAKNLTLFHLCFALGQGEKGWTVSC
jgi:hypothetical protein